ncbi:MAG: ribonuclease P protein component [Dehalococcoidia bacterium]|nr:ribonuclease P protein component [Dehalococcoidia bacterium]MDW8119866.1 ribonuclease P protein component [Chloroflexota bacterium]
MRPQRLTHKRDFDRLQKTGRTYHGRFLFIRTAPNGEQTVRVGFAIAKRLGKAVERNRLRRRLREILRLSPLTPGWDILVVAKGDAVHQTYHTLRDDVGRLLRQAGILGEG